MTAYRTTARVVGALFIVGTVAGVLSVPFQAPAHDAETYLTELSLKDNQVATGALLELVMGAALVRVAIAIYPVLRRRTERLAIAYVAARSIEGVLYVVDVLLLLGLLTLSREFADASAVDASGFQTLGSVLMGGRDWAIGALMPATAFGLSAIILNYALYRATLVPPWLSLWGLLGAVPFLAGGLMVLYGQDAESTTQTVLDAPLAVQEMVFALWLIFRGFNPTAVALDREREPALV